ncbi:MBL fold metallo-hydrolase [Chloroflexota bacterium]
MTERVDKITDEIYRVEIEIPGVSDIFTVYFIKDCCNILIEPGPGTLIPAILTAASGLSITDFQYIIPTHVHMDHAGALGKLTSIFTQATVITNSQGVKHFIDPNRLIRSTKLSFGNDFESTYGSIEPVPDSKIKVVRDQDKLNIKGRDLIFFETPGHAPHHMAIFDTKTGGLFCGEALGLIYKANTQPLPSAAPPNFDLEVYINSMERLRELPIKFLLYSHGGMSREPEKSISKAIENVRVIGDIILQTLKTSTEEVAARSVDNYIQEHFGVKISEYSLMNNIYGYSGYYKRKGLV